MNLYHYTCRDSLAAIRASGWELKPNRGVIGGPLVWLTDMPQPDRLALGLSSHSLNCDRTEHRLTVPSPVTAVPWWQWCRRNGITRAQRDLLELAPGAQPLRWWVSPDPVQAEP